jgi:hypothetical protein
MNSASAALVDFDPDAAAADLCSTCKHPLDSHDAISVRWCAATELGIAHRQCICSGVAASAPVLTHY